MLVREILFSGGSEAERVLAGEIADFSGPLLN
jgi:hypothetical protein